jgi:hypothetical protein
MWYIKETTPKGSNQSITAQTREKMPKKNILTEEMRQAIREEVNEAMRKRHKAMDEFLKGLVRLHNGIPNRIEELDKEEEMFLRERESRLREEKKEKARAAKAYEKYFAEEAQKKGEQTPQDS